MKSDNDAILIFRGWFVSGLSAGRGMIVARSEYVAFLPTEKMVHLGWTIAEGVVFAGAGLVEIGGGRRIQLDQWIENVRQLPVAEFDTQLTDLIGKIGGVIWRREEVKVIYKRLLFRRKKGLWFQGPKGSMRVARPLLDGELFPRVQQLLDGWAQ